jgi:hypothetical protein
MSKQQVLAPKRPCRAACGNGGRAAAVLRPDVSKDLSRVYTYRYFVVDDSFIGWYMLCARANDVIIGFQLDKYSVSQNMWAFNGWALLKLEGCVLVALKTQKVDVVVPLQSTQLASCSQDSC